MKLQYLKTFENYGKYDKLVDFNTHPMLRGYIECALSVDLPEEHTGEIGSEDINENSLIEASEDVRKFKELAGNILDGMDKDTLKNVGMDFWYSRNGHGTGFWDYATTKRYPEDVANKLEEIAKTFPSKSVFVEGDEFIIE